MITILWLIIVTTHSQAQTTCPGNLVSNDDFSAGLTNWSQYGTVPTAIVLNASSGCLNNFLALQATNNSNVGVSQNISFIRDTCYQLCYCVEFPGGNFNSKLTIAAIMPGVTVAQLLTGTYTPGQAQVIDVISSSTGIAAYNRCPMTFTATGNFTDLVIVNETIGLYGSDVRIDNICLTTHPCSGGCGNEKANFIYTFGVGNNVVFTDISSSSPGSTISWAWNFGDPPSGANNTSNLQNPAHIFSAPGTYTVCLNFVSITTMGIVCSDNICINVVIPLTTGIKEESEINFFLSPIPAIDYLMISGDFQSGEFELFNTSGKSLFSTSLVSTKVLLPELPNGIYFAAIQTKKGKSIHKILIFR